MRYEIEIEANLGLEWKPVAFRAPKVGEHYYNVVLGEPCPVSPTAPLAGVCRLIVEKRPSEQTPFAGPQLIYVEPGAITFNVIFSSIARIDRHQLNLALENRVALPLNGYWIVDEKGKAFYFGKTFGSDVLVAYNNCTGQG